MSLSDSNSELSYDSDNQESRSMCSFDLEVEDIEDATGEHEDSVGDSTKKDELTYADEPLADEKWLKNYE